MRSWTFDMKLKRYFFLWMKYLLYKLSNIFLKYNLKQLINFIYFFSYDNFIYKKTMNNKSLYIFKILDNDTWTPLVCNHLEKSGEKIEISCWYYWSHDVIKKLQNVSRMFRNVCLNNRILNFWWVKRRSGDKSSHVLW